MPLTSLSTDLLFAQSPFGLTWSSYVAAPGTGSQSKTTSSTAVVVVFAGLRSVGLPGQSIEYSRVGEYSLLIPSGDSPRTRQ